MNCAWCGFEITEYRETGSPFVWMHPDRDRNGNTGLYGFCDNPFSGQARWGRDERPRHDPIRHWRRAEPESTQRRLV